MKGLSMMKQKPAHTNIAKAEKNITLLDAIFKTSATRQDKDSFLLNY